MTHTYTELGVSTIAYSALGFLLRQEYQPKAIAEMGNSVEGNKKFLVGCGGGKSLMMAMGVAFQIINGAKKIVITAPSIRLCRQLEYEFIDTFSKMSKIPKRITFFNVSSDGKKKSIDLDADDLAEEAVDTDADEKISGNEAEATALARNFGGRRNGSQNHDDIEEYLQSADVVIFFVCKPSFLKNFRRRVATVVNDIDNNFKIDVTCHDEFHNYISTNKKDSCKSALYSYGTYSNNNWFFSASKRATERLTWKDRIFGDLVVDVPSADLVKWGYLVPKLKIYIVTASMISKIEDPIKQKFELMYKANAADFMREAKVVLRVMEDQSARGNPSPKILHFSKRVAFTREMNTSLEFKTRVDSILSGMSLFQMDGSTDRKEREDIFTKLKSLPADMGSCVLQHSIFSQGINCPNFDTAIIARGMSEISLQQALGRIQRAYAGKDCAYLYLYVDDEAYIETMKNLAVFLHYGLGKFDCTVERLGDDQSGTEGDDEDDNEDVGRPDLSSVKVKLRDPAVVIDEYIAHLNEKESQLAKFFEIDALDNEDALDDFSKFAKEDLNREDVFDWAEHPEKNLFG